MQLGERDPEGREREKDGKKEQDCSPLSKRKKTKINEYPTERKINSGKN